MRNELMASGPYMQRGNRERKEIKCFLSACMGNEMITRQFCSNLMGALTACFAGNIVVSRDKELAQKQYLQCRAQTIPSLWNDAHKALGFLGMIEAATVFIPVALMYTTVLIVQKWSA